MKILCGRCQKSVSTEVPEKTIVMAWIECPDCLRKKNKNRSDINNSYTINIMDAEKIDQALRCSGINAIKEIIMNQDLKKPLDKLRDKVKSALLDFTKETGIEVRHYAACLSPTESTRTARIVDYSMKINIGF